MPQNHFPIFDLLSLDDSMQSALNKKLMAHFSEANVQSDVNSLKELVKSDFFELIETQKFEIKKIRYKNSKLISELNKSNAISELNDHEWLKHFGELYPLPNNIPFALAMKYHGHQFQHYNPELGDGRGFLHSQFIINNQLFELGTKGSGVTPFSRRGDGRLTLKGAFREALCTNYLEFQNVNTSKTFSIIETAEKLIRYDEPSPTRSSILFRWSHGHIRIGTFQRCHYYKSADNINKLLNYCLNNFYPNIQKSFDPVIDSFLFLNNVYLRLSNLCASYFISGFVHGVLNTDNINVSGESFDYGPYRFIPHFDPNFTAAYFDHEGLYSYGKQHLAFLWNLEKLKDCIEFANPNLEKFTKSFSIEFEKLSAPEEFNYFENLFISSFNIFCIKRFLKKLNLKPLILPHESHLFKDFENDDKIDSYFSINNIQELTAWANTTNQLNETQFYNNCKKLIEVFFKFLSENKNLKFEQTFFDFFSDNHLLNRLKKSAHYTDYLKQPETLTNLLNLITEKFEPINKIAPSYFTENAQPETLLIDEIEELWKPIEKEDDWTSFYNKLLRLENRLYHSS